MKLGFLKMNQTTQTMYFYKFLKIYQHLNTPLSIFVFNMNQKSNKTLKQNPQTKLHEIFQK